MSAKIKRLCLLAVLAVLSASLSLLERPIISAIPLPLPGFKLGLANICTMFCLYRMTKTDCIIVLALRIALTGLLFGNPVSFILSLTGGLCALCGAFMLFRSKKITPVGVSVFSSALHMTGQIFAASIILNTPSLFTSYLPWLLLVSVPTGILNGAIASVLINRIPKISTQQRKEYD